MSTTTQSPQQRIKFSCNKCQKVISTKAKNSGKRGRCPGCGHVQTIPPSSDQDNDQAAPSAVPKITAASVMESMRNRQTRSVIEDLVSRVRRNPATEVFITIGLTFAFIFVVVFLAKAMATGSLSGARLKAFADTIVPRLIALCVFFAPAILAVAAYVLAVHKVRRLRAIIYFTIWLGFPIYCVYFGIIGLLTQDVELLLASIICGVFMGFPWWCVGHWPAKWLTPYIMALFVHRLHCPRCHNNKDLIDVWACSCGYQDHRPRNVLLFSCPQCGKHVGVVDCPYCDASILT